LREINNGLDNLVVSTKRYFTGRGFIE